MVIVSRSKNTDSKKAGQEVADSALSQKVNGNEISWGLLLCGGRHEPETVLASVQARVGNIPLYGGSAVGIITDEPASYSGYETGLALFSGSPPERVIADNLGEGEFEAGEKLGMGLVQKVTEDDTILLFYDNVKTSPPPLLYMGNKILDGLYNKLGNKKPHIIGAGMVGDFTFTPSFLFDGEKTVKHTAIALILRNLRKPETTIMHGCSPVSSFFKITKIEGQVLYELDGHPATDIFTEILGLDHTALRERIAPLMITLGRKFGDRYAPYDEKMYVNRLVIDSNLDTGSVTLFEADFREGEMVQIMSRDNQMMISSVRSGTAEFLQSIDAEQQFDFGLYIDCAGRASGFSGSEEEEANIVSEIIGNKTKLLGFYSGVEIAPFLARSRPLDWTGVLTLFTQENINV